MTGGFAPTDWHDPFEKQLTPFKPQSPVPETVGIWTHWDPWYCSANASVPPAEADGK